MSGKVKIVRLGHVAPIGFRVTGHCKYEHNDSNQKKINKLIFLLSTTQQTSDVGMSCNH